MTSRAETTTILFTDLVGSTEAAEGAGQQTYERYRRQHFAAMREAIASASGTEVKTVGDAFMVAFESAGDAVACGVAMQQAQLRVNRRGIATGLRVGISTGDVTTERGDFFGMPVVEAARLCAIATVGQVLVSDVVRLLDRSGAHTYRPAGAFDLKGMSEPVAASEVVYEHDPTALVRRLPFVGREAELAAMLKRLAEAGNSRGSVVLLAGEPGIGKTRLTEEFCMEASGVATVVRGDCHEGDVAAPFSPWTQALRSLLDAMPDAELRETLGPGGADVAVIVPEIRNRIPDLDDPPKLDPELERARLFDSINAWLRNTAEKKPLVIVLDDLHWCDRPSLALLERVARANAGRRIVILGAYRDVEVDRMHPLAQTLAELRRLEHYERIAVRGVTQESVYDLLGAVGESKQAEPRKRALAEALYGETEGNPFFLREVLNHLIENGTLARRDAAWTGTAAAIEELGIPEGVKDVVGRRLSRLGETCNRMLGRMSGMTRGFTWDEIRTICDEPEDNLLDALDEALGAQLIGERDTNTYEFTHDLIRQTLYGELSTPRRVLLHRRIGDALERIHAADIEPHVSELAHHYHEAAPGGDVEKAIGYAMRAASLSFALVAWEEAAAHCERALHALELLPERDAPREIKILLALSEARGGTGDRAGWEDAALRAAEIARRTGDADAFAHAALGLARAPTVGVDPRIVGLLEEALERLPPADGAFRAMATSRLASELYFSDQHERMTGLERQAVAMARRVGDKSALAYTLHNVLRFGGSFAADVIHGNLADLIEELILLGEDIGSNLAMSEGYLWRAMFHLTRGERDAADADLDVYARLIDEMRSPGSVKFQVRAMQARLDGRLDAVEALAYQGLRDGRRAHPQNAPMFFGAQMTNLRRVQGRLGEIEAAAEGLAAQFPQIPGYRVALAQVYAQQERREETRAVFDELARDDFAILPDQTVRPAMLVDLTDACCYLADRARAAALYEMMLPLADRSVVLAAIVCTGSASTQLGALATTLGRFDDAERHFEDAIAMNRKLRAPTWVAEAQLGYGDMLLRRARPGDRERAVTLAQQAHDFAKECGMGFVERKGAELLTSLA